MRAFAFICSAVVGASVLCSPVIAQAKTAKECRAEWQANKARKQSQENNGKRLREGVRGRRHRYAARRCPKPTKKTEPKAAPAAAAPKNRN